MKRVILLSIMILLQSCLNEASIRAGQKKVASYSRAPSSEDQEPPTPPPETVTRPTLDVFVQSNICGCEKRKAVTNGNCLSFCNQKNDDQATLYGKVKLGADAGLMFGNLKEWCTKPIDVQTDIGLNCFLRIIGRDGHSEDLPVTINRGSNSFSSQITVAHLNNTYVAKLIVVSESDSDYQAESTSFNFSKRQPGDNDDTTQGVLKVTPISRYNCIFRAVRADPSRTNEDATTVGRLNYFFPIKEEPPIIPYADAGQRFYYCHDVELHGLHDSSEFGRLGLEQHYLTFWDQRDHRFYETLSEGKLDINTLIERQLKEVYAIDSNVDIFAPLSWPNSPVSTTPVNLGYYMIPWQDQESGHTFCPKEADYNSSKPEMRVLKNFIGQDTEGLYFAKRDPQFITDADNHEVPVPDDFLLIREGLLKKIWFYYDGSERTITPANELTSNRETLRFFWPLVYDADGEPESPYIKKSGQNIYTIVTSTSDVTGEGATTDGNRTHIPTSDRRFGCIPALKKTD